MKTNASLRIFKVSTLASLGIEVIAALVTQPTVADIFDDNSLVITENSSTSLTATYTFPHGSTLACTVTLLAPDQWTVTLPFESEHLDEFSNLWQEPENPPPTTIGNRISNASSGSNTVSVISDFNAGGIAGTPRPNGFSGTLFGIGTDSANETQIDLTFTDNAATSEPHAAPDTGSTFGLLFVSLLALLGASRLRSIQLA